MTAPEVAPRVAVLDYGIGNLRSAQKALEHVGADAVLTAHRATIEAADAVVLPGVGSFRPCMEAVRATGLDDAARLAVEAGTPFLGICIGMQLLYESSEEAPGVAGLGILPGEVRRLPDTVRRPQMQWNLLERVKPCALLDGLPDPAWMYFVHSYAPDDADHAVATCDYGGPVVAAVEHGQVWATQFHPEKSGATGLALLRRFVDIAAGRVAAADQAVG